MTVERIELRREVLQDVGRNLEKSEDTAKAVFQRAIGAKAILHESVFPGLQSVVALWKKDEEAGKVDHDTLVLAVKVCEQCMGSVRNLMVVADANLLRAQGQAEGLSRALKQVETQFDVEGKRAEAMLKMIEAAQNGEVIEDPKMRPVGAHPGPGLAQKRKASTLVAVPTESENDAEVPVDAAASPVVVPQTDVMSATE